MKFTPALLSILVLLTAVQAQAKVIVISQKDKKFSETEITVKIGDKIIFRNDEKNITHSVYSITPGNEFELKSQKPDTSSTVPIDEDRHHEGEMLVQCAMHTNMKLKVKITK